MTTASLTPPEETPREREVRAVLLIADGGPLAIRPGDDLAGEAFNEAGAVPLSVVHGLERKLFVFKDGGLFTLTRYGETAARDLIAERNRRAADA